MSLKLLTDYLDRAVNFERLASIESNTAARGQFLEQARAYRRLACKKARELGLPPPSPPEPMPSPSAEATSIYHACT